MANERVKELFKDENFLKELGAAETPEEAQKLFEARGGEITVDELKAIRATLKQKAGEKLDADELDLVAGGGGIGGFIGDFIGEAIGEVDRFVGNLITKW